MDEGKRRVRCFEDLRVYQQARELANGIYTLTRRPTFRRDFALADQMRRAAVSVISNIAEGFERGTSQEFVHFLYVTKGSCAELRAQLSLASDQSYLAQDEYTKLVGSCRLVSGMTSRLIAYLGTLPPDSRRRQKARRTA